MDEAPQEAREGSRNRLPGDLGNGLTGLEVLTDLGMGNDFPVCRGAEDSLRVAFGLAGIRLRAPLPVDSPKRMTAAGFNGGLAVLPTDKGGAQAEIELGYVADG